MSFSSDVVVSAKTKLLKELDAWFVKEVIPVITDPYIPVYLLCFTIVTVGLFNCYASSKEVSDEKALKENEEKKNEDKKE